MKGKILVTGGTGYIGSHTVVELQNVGFDVVIVDDLSNSTAAVVNQIEEITGKRPAFHQFNLQNLELLGKFFKECKGIDAVIHFAAFKAVGESVQKPMNYYRNNLVSLINLFECMENAGVNNLVFSSSCTVYGQPEHLPVTEQTPRQTAESPYGNTKIVCEDIIKDYTHANPKIQAIALRYFNPIGAHPSALIGELPNGIPNNLVPFVAQTAAGIRPQLSVFGNDYDTPDGSCIRDYINVVDLAKAHVISIGRLLDQKNESAFEFFNVGTGKGVSVLELLNAFEKATGQKVNYKIVGRRAGDIEQIYADTTKANSVLGWKSVATLEETLLSAWNWEQRIRIKG
ncbi:MAG: UDP-glucose 4-epimerase GalE [Prolixibacteraceae bacterium]|jgi:UDP-glucose 4-epimerase|nr:UDP-glucose 4-epimerase GalE [Prolixibacteraceae bacterium]